MTCTKINLENKSVNDTLTAELDRYKEHVKVLKERQNVELKNQTNFSESNEQNAEIERLKQMLSEQMKEKESLMKTVTVLKTDFQKEENRNIDREIALEKKIKHLDNIIFKRAIGFEKPVYLKKARESEPKLYDGNVILNTDTIEIPDSEETLILVEESHSKMLLKEQDPMVAKKKTSVPPSDPSPSSTSDKVEVPKELPKVSMVNTSLKQLKRHLAGFDQVVKERTTATSITEGTWGFEHTKACFRDEIIPFIKALKDSFNNFNQYLVDELAEVQTAFYQMEQAVEQHPIDNDIVNTVVNLSVNNACENVNECQKCLQLETELINKKDFIEKETYDELFRRYTTLEKHCISLEVDTQLNQEIFQQENSVSNQNDPSFNQLFELNELRAQSQEKDTVIMKLKEQIKSLKGNVDSNNVKINMDEIETLNIELEYRVSKLVAENEHLKQTYKQLYDSIKPACVQSKEQCVALINQVNLKSVEISDLNAKLQEQGLVLTSLKNDLRKLKGKALVDDAKTLPVDLTVSKMDMEPITPKLLNKRTAHSAYIKHTQEEVFVLRDIVEHVKANYPQDPILESAFRYTKVIQDLLSHIRIRLSTSAYGSQPSGNTRNDKIQRSPSSNLKNKVEARSRNVKSNMNKKNDIVKRNGSASVQYSKKIDNSDSVCIKCDNCMSSDNLITTTTTEVPSRKPTILETETPKPVVTKAYSRKPRKNKKTDSVSKSKVVKSSYVAFRQHTCYIRNLEGVDLLTGSRGDNLYTLSLGDIMASSPICLLSKASKTKSWLWHRRLSHLNFGAINHLAKHGLVRGLPKLKFEKDHLCSACALGKSTKKPHKPKSEDTNQEKLNLLHMDLCGPMRITSVNGKKYILVIVDDYSRFTWVKCLRSKDEAPAFIINFLKMIQVRLKEPV
ncbi:retrovirus-related pol polyprotein from transposon TNT 1-94 [Tanacetum coccineum]|uniref:Retrovirus-related pol polyprotein from transposon TNT 1-94 n=1 Tax=Tanacetum coccineum TaxID=301880 RepID=A0ABQ4XSJ5_9ASTR